MKYFKLKHFYFLAALFLAGLGGCNREPVDPPGADGAYLQTLVDQDLVTISPDGSLVNCRRSATYLAGQYALIEVVCDGDDRMEYIYHASGRAVFMLRFWYASKEISLITKQQLINAVGVPRREAGMLIDMRDRP